MGNTVALTNVSLDTVPNVSLRDLTEEQISAVRSFRLDREAIKAGKADYSVADAALAIGLQNDYAEAERGVAMVNAGLFVYDMLVNRDAVGKGKTFENRAALAKAIRRSEGYVSRLQWIGKAAALGLSEDQVSFVVNNPGGKTTDALKAADTKTAATKAVKALVAEAAKADKGKGGTKTPRKPGGSTDQTGEGDGRSTKADAKAETPQRVLKPTTGDFKDGWAQLEAILKALPDAEAEAMRDHVARRLDSDAKRREALAAKAAREEHGGQ